MVLKTRPDQLVQPGTRHQFGLIIIKNLKLRKKNEKSETAGSTGKIENWCGQTGFGMFDGRLNHCCFEPKKKKEEDEIQVKKIQNLDAQRECDP